MAKGSVTSFNSNTGYGFIKSESGEDGIFVYQKDILMDGFRHLKPSDIVEFDLTEGDRGLKAINVKLVRRTKKRPVRRRHSIEDKFNRLLEVLSSEGEDIDPIITNDDMDYILEGKS